jgi:hypothetical protein
MIEPLVLDPLEIFGEPETPNKDLLWLTEDLITEVFGAKPAKQKTYDKKLKLTQETKKYAEENGWEFHPAGPSVLFVDLDSKEELSRFDKLYKFAKATSIGGLFKDTPKINPSKSGEGYHVRIPLVKDMFLVDRIALQACLGGDCRHGIASLARYMDKDDVPILFFEDREKMLQQVDYVPEI